MSGNDYLGEIVKKLTWLGALNLRSTVTSPDPLNPDAVHGIGRMYLGFGKWTTIGCMGVERHLVKLGLGEMVAGGTRQYLWCRITPLGREMAAYLDAHWDSLLLDGFREGKGK